MNYVGCTSKVDIKRAQGKKERLASMLWPTNQKIVT